jgi:hypothetical protein
MNNGDMPASPTIYADMGHNGQREIFCDNTGLTKREAFAMAAMQGLASESGRYHLFTEMVGDAVFIADALLAELAKEQTK